MRRPSHRTDDRSRLWHNRLWILAALLGAATIYSSARMIHDTSQRRVAANLVRRETAQRVAMFATRRAEILALAALAPGVAADSRANPRAVLAAMVARQADAAACRCRDTISVRGFFHVDPTTHKIDFIAVLGDSARPPESTVLVEIARRDFGRVAPPPAIHLTTARDLGDFAALTYTQRASPSGAGAVYGLVARRADLGNALFAEADRSTTVVDLGARMATLDSTSLLAVGQDSQPLFGAITTNYRLAAVTYPRGALEGTAVTVALGGWQIHSSLLAIIPSNWLWHNGMLILATILVIASAIGSGRRELLLARARSDFIAGVSHDLRMPLAQILLASETMIVHRDTNERERLGLANTILREARRLIALVENVLLFSRAGAVKVTARVEPLSVDDLFAATTEAVNLAADDARQSLEVQPASNVAVLGDRQLLRQALVNLVDNSLKYGKPGQRIRLSAERSGDSRVRLYVDDQGPGIPAAERERVFEPYERLGKDQTSERTGTGLGLAVTRQIVGSCGGRVWLDAAPGGGTRAAIELASAAMPAATAHAEARAGETV